MFLHNLLIFRELRDMIICDYITSLRPYSGKNLPQGQILPLCPSILINYAVPKLCLWPSVFCEQL